MNKYIEKNLCVKLDNYQKSCTWIYMLYHNACIFTTHVLMTEL